MATRRTQSTRISELEERIEELEDNIDHAHYGHDHEQNGDANHVCSLPRRQRLWYRSSLVF